MSPVNMDQALEHIPHKKLDSFLKEGVQADKTACDQPLMDEIEQDCTMPTAQSVQRSGIRGIGYTKSGCQRRCHLNAMLTIKHQLHGEIDKGRLRPSTALLAPRDSLFNTFFFAILLAICSSKIHCTSIQRTHEHMLSNSASNKINQNEHQVLAPKNQNFQPRSRRPTGEMDGFRVAPQPQDEPVYPSYQPIQSSTDVDPVPNKYTFVSSMQTKTSRPRRAKSLTESGRFTVIDDGNNNDSERHMNSLIKRLEESENVANQIFNQTADSETLQSKSHSSELKDSIKQKGSKLIKSEIPFANTSGSQNGSDERIDVKHRYTFTVNGKELALEPPSSSAYSSPDVVDSASNSSITSESTKPNSKNPESVSKSKKKVNRIGEYINPDYDSGFEIGSGTESETSPLPTATQSGSFSRQYPTNSGVTKGRLSASSEIHSTSAQPPSSSSSSLMSPSRHNGEDNYGDNEELPFSSAALSSYENNISQSVSTGRNHELGKQDNALDFGGNKIISDWPKSDSSKQLSTKSDRHSSTTSNSLSPNNDKPMVTKIQNQGSSTKFPAPLHAGNNEVANQSGEQQPVQRGWDARQLSLESQSGFIKQSKAPQAGTKALVSGRATALMETSVSSNDNDSSSYSKTSPRRNTYPRAPVNAKARYSSQAQTLQSPPSQSTSGDAVNSEGKSTHVKQNGRQLAKGESKGLKELGNNDSRNSHLHIRGKHLTATSTVPTPTTRSNESANTIRSARFDKSINGPIIPKFSANVDSLSAPSLSVSNQNQHNVNGASNPTEHTLTPNSISEYKTNFTAQMPTSLKHSISAGSNTHHKIVDGGKSEVIKKSHISQRDLSSKLLPFTPSPFVNSNHGGFKPTEPNSIYQKSFIRSSAIIDGLKNSVLNDSSGGNSLHRISSPDVGRYANDRSIVRTGPILPNPLASYSQLKAFMPGLFARESQDDYQTQAATNQFRALLAGHQLSASGQSSYLLPAHDYPFSRATSSSTNQNLSGADQMLATSNHHSVAHLTPQASMGSSMGESSNYNSIANLQDYPERQISNHDQISNSQESSINSNSQPPSATNMNSDEHSRGGYSETDQNSFEPNASVRSSTQNIAPSDQTTTNSRSSVSDVYLRTEHKNRGDSASGYPLRSSADPFEDIAGGLSTSEYERDLADLDEEFNRHSSYRRPSNPLMSDSFMTMSPERYEARRYNRRPNFDYTADYLNTAGSISSIIPRPYQRSHASPWSSSPTYSDSSDLWADTSVDYNPLASFVSSNHYAYRWRPRYQRVSPYSGSPYLATSASEQHLQPAYNIIPSYTSAMPTETISYALSPLAAAAAAAASALVAADKTRHQNHGWLALPRLAASSSISPTPTAASASTQHASTIPAGAIQTAYIHRPNPYAMGSVPIYAIAPRPAAPLTTAGSAATASIIPYFHGGAPTIIAYRPAGMVPSASLLAAHSFAYPLRLPVSTIHRPASLAIAAPTRTVGRPFYSDLAFAESKSKTNLTSNSSEGKGLVRAGSLTAMAKNLTKKMFGSASQIRPQHVAPPNAIFEQYAPSQNSTSATLSSSIAI